MPSASARLKSATSPQLLRAMDYRLEDFTLDTVGSKALDLNIEGSVTAAVLEMTVEGATSFTVTVADPENRLVRSDTLMRWAWGDTGYLDETAWVRRGREVGARLDDLVFRLVKVSRRGNSRELDLVFEDRSVFNLRHRRGPKKVSRGKVTRAEFVHLLARAVKADGGIDTHIPELHAKQPIERAAKTKTEKTSDGDPGLSDSADLTVKGNKMTASQRKQAEIVLDVCEAEGAGPKATLAAVCAAIGESEFKVVMNRGGSPYGGVFQGNVRDGTWRIDDTAGMTRAFLRGGKGFQGGGAIKLAKSSMSVGLIAVTVEGSRANFASDQAAEHHYGQHHDEAERIIRAYGGGAGTSLETYTKAFDFEVNGPQDGEPAETYWDAMGRLAEEVNWRRFMRSGRLWYASEPYLFRQRPVLNIVEGEGGVDSVDFDVDMGARDPVSEVSVTCRADRWTALPGMVATVEGQGVADGRWLVSTIRVDLADPSGSAEVTLRKPIPVKPEPRAEEATRPSDEGGKGGKVAEAYSAADHISSQNRSYVYGGGHGPSLSAIGPHDGLDCSSSTSLALKRAGMFDGTAAIVSGAFKSWGRPGRGKYMTVWFNAGHVWIEFNVPGKRGKRFDTSAHGDGPSGPHMRYSERSTAGFQPRHWPGT